jgi:hypothetical protein
MLKAIIVSLLTTVVLATAGCSSAPSGPSQAELDKQQAAFCGLVLQWIKANENFNADPDTAVRLDTQLGEDAETLTSELDYSPNGDTPSELVGQMTQFEAGYRTAVDALRMYCQNDGIVIPQWGQA